MNTQPHKKLWKVIAAFMALAMLFSACSSSDGDDVASGADDTAMADDATLGAYGPGCAAVPADGEGSFAGMADDPAGTAASNNPVLSTLVTAVVAADLVDTLNSDGPFTIFAPTNDAFAAVPEDILAAVLADKDLLTSVLTYHVIAGESLSADDLGGNTYATVEGGDVELAANGEGVNGASVICSNVPVANGTVHIVDAVLLPQVAQDAIAALTAMEDESAMDDDAMEEEDAMEDESAMDDDAMEEEDAMSETAMMLDATGPGCSAVPADGEGSFAGMADDTAGTAASNNPVLSTLVTAVVEADLVDTLNSDGPFTIFAPSNSAFEAIPADALNAVLADKDLLTSILTLHVIAGESLQAEDLVDGASFTTVNGEELNFEFIDDNQLSVNGVATAICQNVVTANATVHIIDAVLMPTS